MIEKLVSCRECKRKLPLSAFYKAGKWLDKKCKKCKVAYQLLYEEKLVAVQLAEKRYFSIKSLSKRNGKSWDNTITKEIFLKDFYKKPCHYQSKFCLGASTGLDRVDNAKGYTLSNVVPACIECNRRKFTRKELPNYK